jgi:endoglucanase
MFNVGNTEPFPETDFAWISELGFNYVRLPLDYRCWIPPNDMSRVREEALKPIDEAVALGRKHGIHVQINFHRAPGYTVASPKEPLSVWRDSEALKACQTHWRTFARRYREIPNSALSFNPFNEPDNKVSADDHRRVVEEITGVIREIDPGRLIVCDGRSWGAKPPDELMGLNVAAATRGYEPTRVSHWHAPWIPGSDNWPEPTWPLQQDGRRVDRARLAADLIAPWKSLEARGLGVTVGEFGAHNRTPHPVVLAWLTDFLSLWKEAGWGWALWNFRGSFGILDSGRRDVTYESFHGHKLDRALLELLQAS